MRQLLGPGSPFGRSGSEAAIRLVLLVVLFAGGPSAAGLLGDSTDAIIALFVVGIAVTAWATVLRYRAAKERIQIESERRENH
jgi:hypothetical protein